ncbi:ribonuclease P protein component [Horticoccus luteus]|uniref:Ribonuclease P protein component n=1 Tax=Horticoccus luteus TaxID=2862869 RepID=A0A8F9XHE3_9BACT|nr:ribonuclease P protein component [Horticoccus luteus]QYM79240.1 ribonuclease P protein component [Horticoccus luteus]
MRFRPEQHLRRQSDFRAVREQGRRFDGGAFTVWWRRRETDETGPARIGFVASRAAVGNAVQRARAKRRLREMARRHQSLVPAGYDLMIIARRSATTVPWNEMEQRFAAACRKTFPHA